MAQFSRNGNIGIITLQNPPMNTLSDDDIEWTVTSAMYRTNFKVRKSLSDCIEKANKDHTVKSILLHGDGRAFCAGAEISEFKSGSRNNGPTLNELIQIIEDSSKPVVAAIHGFAMGGGLEIALSSHYRIAHPNTRFGFPEVAIGILPAATGTQRLPRVTDLNSAIEIICGGQPFSAQFALKKGIIDKIIDGTFMSEAKAFAESVADQPVEPRMVRKLPLRNKHDAPLIFQGAERIIRQRARGAMAPVFCLKAIQAAYETETYEDGIDKELSIAYVLMVSFQASALQYGFFAERKVGKWELPGSSYNHSNTKPKTISSCAVIGGGLMGTGITMSLITHGLPTYIVEQNRKYLDKAVQVLRKLIERDVKKQRITQDEAAKRLKLLKPTLNYNDLRNADIVIEAVFENMELKKTIFARLDKVCKSDAILASNTSGLNIDEIASVTRRPKKVIGTHFFSPAHIMRLLENVRGKLTSPETIASVMNLGKRIKKISVLVGNCPLFVGNRVMQPFGTEAAFLLEEGALPHEVDQVLEDFGFPMGPFKVGDLAGLDIGYKGRTELGKIKRKGQEDRMRDGGRYSPLADFLVEQNRLGQKTGKGWYNYGQPGGRKPEIDPEVEKMILDFCDRNNIVRRRITPQEIQERMLYSLMNECFKVLEEGIAARDEDIDIMCLYGYGWPRYTGGPMFYARNKIGLKELYGRIKYYQVEHPNVQHWAPSRNLETAVLSKMMNSVL